MVTPQKSTELSITLTGIHCQQLQGVGPKIAAYLAKCGINTLQDLLFHLPLRYEDRTHITPINTLQCGQHVLLKGIIHTEITPARRRKDFSCSLVDETGSIKLRFFHFTPQQCKQFKAGAHLLCFGEVRARTGKLFEWEMIHPDYELLPPYAPLTLPCYLTGVYPSTQGLSQRVWHKLIEQVFALLFPQRTSTATIKSNDYFPDYLPDTLLKTMNLPHLLNALHYIHRPPPQASIEILLSRKHVMQQRLILEELLAHSLSLRQMKKNREQASAPPLNTQGPLHQRFLISLSFQLTTAQERIIKEIRQDMEKPYPMQRLLQGDVGSGKTVIAAFSAIQAVENNYQVALMAPTELLSEQHYQQFYHWLMPLGFHIVCLNATLKMNDKKKILLAIKNGEAQIILGTHALFQEGVEFSKLGLIIIDEQHRFGVQQRLALWKKSQKKTLQAHQLLMTATPIPRTLAMAAYPNLDISLLDESPPGRLPVHTIVLSDKRRQALIERVRHTCTQKKQAYWVCPLIEESDSLHYQAAKTTLKKLQFHLPELRISLIHGRLSAYEKKHIMSSFKEGNIDLLVATSVIEVGVDVGHASLIVIENAERLGLAQLHQLRGRVGRSTIKSYCVLLYQHLSPLAKERLSIIRQSQDGLMIAQRDLELRGPGEIWGLRQTGWQNLHIADLSRDHYLLSRVQNLSNIITTKYPDLIEPIIQRWTKHNKHHCSTV